MVSDSIADFCTRIRNGYMSRKQVLLVPYSNMKLAMAKILLKEGYIGNVTEKKEKSSKKNDFRFLEISLKYAEDGSPALTHIERISKPGLRIYKNVYKLPKVLSGLGLAIISTSKGVMTDKTAKKQKIGGEILCQVW